MSAATDAAPEMPVLPPRHPGRLAVVGVTVLPMTDPAAPRLVDQTVIVQDGRIAAVGPRTAVPLDGAQIVEGAGRFLLPGLTDAHVHLTSFADTVAYLAAGVTRVRHMFGYPEHLAYARLVEAGRWAGPRLTSASTIVDGLGPGGYPQLPGSVGVADPAAAEELVRVFREAGYAHLKGYSRLSPAMHAALGRACREQGFAFGGHCPAALSVERAVEQGQSSFEHLNSIGRGRLGPDGEALFDRLTAAGRYPEFDAEVLERLAGQLDQRAVDRLGQQLAEQQVWNCPTLVVRDHGLAPAASFADADWQAHVSPANRALWQAMRAAWPERPELLALRDRLRDTMLATVATLHQAGAPLLIGTDAPNPWVAPGAAVAEELANFVTAGLRPFDALWCATGAPARFLGLPAGSGTVDVGAPADLLLLDADPLLDIAAVRRIRAVLVNGWHLDRAALDRLLAQTGAAQEWPPARLPAPGPDTAVESAGVLVAQLFGLPSGSAAYRCCRLDDGRRLLEEVESQPGVRLDRRVELTAEGRLDHAEVRRRTPVGEGRTTVAVTAAGVRIEVDDHGVRSTRTHPVDRPVVAGTGLAVTALPHTPPGPATAVVLTATGAHLAPAEVSRDDAGTTAAYEHWAVPTNFVLGASAARVSAAADGSVAAASDLTRSAVGDQGRTLEPESG